MEQRMQQHPHWQFVFVEELEQAINDERAVVHRGFNYVPPFALAGIDPQLQRFRAGFEEFESARRDRATLASRVALAEIGWQPLEQAIGEDAEAALVFKMFGGFMLTCFAGHGFT